MRNRNERIVKTNSDWRKHNQIKKMKILITVIAVTLCLSVAAGAVLVWVHIKSHTAKPTASSTPASSAVNSEETLPVYDDSFNLTLVNFSNKLSSDYKAELTDFNGISVDKRILPALKKMTDDAAAANCTLKLTGGYVSAQEQDKIFQAQVQNLMKNQGLSQVIAENQAQTTVGKGGYNENQTGLAVDFSAQGKSNFASTPQYKWLIKNCVNYGFVLRFSESKTSFTEMDYNPCRFRYVGEKNAVKMREYSMCLEEYVAYINKQAQD